MYLIKHPKTLKQKMHAVSPVVATLVLIVVAIVGAIAVGLIMSRVASNTSNQANVQNVSSNAAQTLTIGGSTTVYPVSASAVAAFEAEYPGVNVQVAQGGSGAGMEGVIIGAINIGEASSYPTASSYSSSAAAQNPPVNLVETNIGGSGVVAISNSGGTGTGGLLYTGTAATPTNICFGITSDAMYEIYQLGTFYILPTYTNGANTVTTCAPTTSATTADGYLVAAALTGAPGAGESGPFTAVSRSDIPSGTQETFGAWMGYGSSAQDSAQFGASGATGKTEIGNPGVLSYIQGNVGTVGFVDIGFAEGATALKAAGVAIPAIVTSTSPTPSTVTAATATSETAVPSSITAATLATSVAGGNVIGTPFTCPTATVPSSTTSAGIYCYAESGVGTANLDTTIKNALSGAGPEFPDNGAGNNQLSRTFWLATLGNPTPVEQDWINFLTNPGSTTFFTNQGYYSVYQYRTG
jgi:phosphate transport system substrate-binding protein